METEEYVQQLQAIDQMLEDCPEGDERSELLNLKQNIEELLSLTREVQKHSDTCLKDETVLKTKETKLENDTKIDDEYALFMAEMAKEGAVDVPSDLSKDNVCTIPNKLTALKKNSNSLKQLEGKKFKAPHRHPWGQVVYHNAMVCSVPDDIPPSYEFEVKVLFLNPTHKEMLPCPYYFHLEKDCKFKEGGCGYSHGELVPFASLQEYVEPKFELLTIGSDVLAMQTNSLWSRAKITQIIKERNVCLVKYVSKNVENQSFEEIPFPHILPLVTSDCNSDEDDSDGDSDVEVVEEDFEVQIQKDRQELINTSLMTTPDSERLGDWEKYTKGIGSKLMQKMGYIVGTGLGKEGSGIIKPVTAILLPQGKSLDYCMNLKEKQNNRDLFNADHRKPFRERRRKHLAREAKSIAKFKMRCEEMNLVEFINHRFSTKKAHWKYTEEQEYELLKDKLKLGLDRDVNTSNFIIEEKIKKCQEVVANLITCVKRLEEVHADTHKIQQKLKDRQADVKKFNTYKIVINYEITRRKNNKEMAVF